ncbi:MAG: hypothetical protein AAF492_20315, partial [Verrucomicrobiota bacterium]
MVKQQVALAILGLLAALLSAGHQETPTASDTTTRFRINAGAGSGTSPHDNNDSSEARPAPASTFASFRAWTQSQDPDDKVDLALAMKRRTALKQLIRTDPEEALAMALPWTVRRTLSPAVRAHLERPISHEGDYEVIV